MRKTVEVIDGEERPRSTETAVAMLWDAVDDAFVAAGFPTDAVVAQRAKAREGGRRKTYLTEKKIKDWRRKRRVPCWDAAYKVKRGARARSVNDQQDEVAARTLAIGVVQATSERSAPARSGKVAVPTARRPTNREGSTRPSAVACAVMVLVLGLVSGSSVIREAGTPEEPETSTGSPERYSDVRGSRGSGRGILCNGHYDVAYSGAYLRKEDGRPLTRVPAGLAVLVSVRNSSASLWSVMTEERRGWMLRNDLDPVCD